jgi:hypothetical protein
MIIATIPPTSLPAVAFNTAARAASAETPAVADSPALAFQAAVRRAVTAGRAQVVQSAADAAMRVEVSPPVLPRLSGGHAPLPLAGDSRRPAPIDGFAQARLMQLISDRADLDGKGAARAPLSATTPLRRSANGVGSLTYNGEPGSPYSEVSGTRLLR